MALFKAKIRGETPRNGENKNYRSVPFQPDTQQKIPKKQEKIKNISFCIHLKPKQVGKGRERQKTKIIVPFRYYPTHNRKFQKNRIKIRII